MTRRLVVVGGDAAGMSAASQALRTAGRRLDVVALEATSHVSYSACGIPYWLAGDVADAQALVARTARQHRANGIDLRLGHRVVELDLDRAQVVAEVHADPADAGSRARTERIGFDDVLLATGAAPVLPDWAHGVPGVLPVTTLDHGAAWHRLLGGAGRASDRRGGAGPAAGRLDGSGRSTGRPRRALVVGGGYIGVEVAESFARRGLATTLVTRGPRLMGQSLDPAVSDLVAQGLRDAGVRVFTDRTVDELDHVDGQLRAACLGAGGDQLEEPVDVVAVAVGVQPRVHLATDAGLDVGEHGALVPDDRQLLRGGPGAGVWAAGDCCQVWDRVLGESWYTPLATHANKAGRVAGTNLGGGEARFAGSVGTAITRAGRVEVARTGVLRRWVEPRGWHVEQVTLESTTAAGYLPEAEPMTVSVLGERGTGRLLGAQVVGGRGAGKRIDVAAMALWAGLTAADVAAADLAYCPPFSPTLDPVAVACRKLADLL
ncbi:MAG: FAD-dependent oxidoreductase [Angustibacter sp.]